MGTPHTWHTGNSAVGCLWPIKPTVYPNELFSSWLVRSALAQGCSPATLTGYIWPNWRCWGVDIDRGASVDKIKHLSNITGVQDVLIKRMFPSTYLPNQPYTGTQPWLLTLGIRSVQRSRGVQFCPLCLLGDKQPYYRLYWRLGWHTYCEKHRILLLDQCPHCHSSVILHRLNPTAKHIAICHQCGFDLSHAVVGNIQPLLNTIQALLDNISIYPPVASNEKASVCQYQWVRFLCQFVAKCITHHSNPGKEFLCSLSGFSKNMTIRKQLSLENMNVIERNQLLHVVSIINNMGIDKFKEELIRSGISRQFIGNNSIYLPESIKNILPSLKDNSRSKAIKKKSNKTNVPLSTHQVKKSAKRLKLMINQAINSEQ